MSTWRSSRRGRVAALTAGILLGLSACSTNEVAEPLGAPGLAALAKERPLPLRFLLAPIIDARPAARPSEPLTPPATARTEGIPATDAATALDVAPVPDFEPEALRVEVRDALARARLAESIDLAAITGLDERDEAARRAQLLRAAYHDPVRKDVLLETRLRRHEVAYLGGHTFPARYWLTVLSTLTLYWPHWWIAATDYECRLELDVTARAVASERVLLQKTYRRTVRRQLSEWERGLSLFGPILYRQISLDERHWREASRIVSPLARSELFAELAADLKSISPRDPALAGAHLVAAGPGVFDAARLSGRALLQAEKDVAEVADALTGSGIVPAKNAEVLVAGNATRAEVLSRIQRAARAARPDDLLYVVFAGFGAAHGETPVLVPSDFDPARPRETGISLDALARALEGPSRQAILVDASFGGAGRPLVRTLATDLAAGEPGISIGPRAWDPLRRERRAVVLSAGADGLARSGERHGLFTGFLLEALRSRETRPDAEGIVTLNAIFERVRVSAMSATDDPPQEPVWLGAGLAAQASEVAIPLYRARASGAERR